MIVTDKLYIINLKANLMAYRNLKYIIAIKRISSLNRGRLMSFLREKRNDLASIMGEGITTNFQKRSSKYDRRARLSEELKKSSSVDRAIIIEYILDRIHKKKIYGNVTIIIINNPHCFSDSLRRLALLGEKTMLRI